ncbi:lamin tail domain-containing protein [Bacillus cihuensis]|uniref:lamin tail domain-containing protein n=1 Tax=Bacillus cihuensis TaxID=1208599 RepID=UPI00040B2396|nr:lamin tail domain-containing protein [Bacillus cihuensis]
MKNKRFRVLMSYILVFSLVLPNFILITPIITNAEELEKVSIPQVSTGEGSVHTDSSTEPIKSTLEGTDESADSSNSVTETTPSPETTTVEDFNSLPHLLITEISPDSAGTDNYEFFELYNNTNQPLLLNNYSFIYRYLDTGVEKPFQIPSNITIEPQETFVFWFNNTGKTLAEFNAQFNINLTEDKVIPFKDVFPGFANGGNRALVIKDQTGKEIISAGYLPGETDNTGKVVQFNYPKTGTEMEKFQTLANPTPGAIVPVQVPATAVILPEIIEDTVAPDIQHSAVKNSEAYTPIRIEAAVTDDKAVPYATLHFKKEGDEQFTSISMTATPEDSSKFSVEIPAETVESDLIYYIEAADGKNITKTSEYNIAVAKPVVDYNKLPDFLVTEVVPDSANVGGADGYEFIEIYNNTNKDINFKDYKMQYRYGEDPNSDVIWESVPDNVVIKSRETLVFWIINEQNEKKTVADFNANYNSNLVETEDIVRIYSAGMANGSVRGLVVATNTGFESSVAYYNEVTGIDDTYPDKGITYRYPVDGSNKMIKISAGKNAATPGKVQSGQVPAKTVEVQDDSVSPTVEDLTGKTEIKQLEDLKIKADATDNVKVKTVALYYKNNEQTEYKRALLQQDYNDLLYHYTIYSPDLIGKENIEYYFIVSDGANEVKSNTYKVKITSDKNPDKLRLNVKNGDFLSGEEIIKGSSSDATQENVKLFIDESELKEQTYYALEDESYLAFEVSNVNTFFQNGVTMGDEVLRIFDDGIIDWQTITIPIQPEKIKIGENTFTIRSGDKASPFPSNAGENRDDYSLRNVRLVLTDGTVINDPVYTDPDKVIAMKDDNPAVNFTFSLPVEKAPSKAYKWNTTTVSDGAHTIKVSDPVNGERTATVKVDNTAPVIAPSIEKNKEYKGEFIIDPSITDEIAGIDKAEVKLDNEPITVPYKTSSSQLAPGNHELLITAIDKVGNKTELSIRFSVVDELPSKPELLSPNDGDPGVKGSPTLKVKVTDPTNDDMNVSFYKGFTYNAANKDYVKAFKHAADVEPPQMAVPEGETSFTDEDISKVTASDDEYLMTDSTTQFPYHRFDVTLDRSVDEDDVVELSWEGHSLIGRKVTMYAWNHTKNNWMAIDYKIAGESDFSLKQTVPVNEYVKNSKINVMIQDEIPASPNDYDYTFVWMSDTQYYSESYPHIYERQTQWIAEMQEALKIKYVIHTGDLVDESDKQYQWNNADQFMKVLDDAKVPYGVLAGNHDVDHKTGDYTNYSQYFGEDRFKDKPYYGESYKNNRGHYDLISANGNDYIITYMGWGVDDESIAWLNEVLAAYPDRKAILSFHEYLLSTGTRHPLGEKIYNQVVVPNTNVIAVLSGHYHEAQTLVDSIDDDGDGTPDRQVYQMLADYQAGPEGGQGYMRLLHFDTDQNRILVNTYSPYLNDYNYYDTDKYAGKDEFVINLDLQPQEKRVATDSFEVNVYTNSDIGKVENVKSGKTAQVDWKGLPANHTYSWYAVAEDIYTGRTVSDIWSFRKGNPKHEVEKEKFSGK